MIVLAVLAIAAGVLSGGGAKAVLVPAAGGMLLLFIGVAMISSRLVAPLILIVALIRLTESRRIWPAFRAKRWDA